VSGVEYTHPDVLTRGVQEGWAEAETDPTRINWAARQARAAIPFQVINGRPVNPVESTGITRGRNELGHWGEQLCADALVVALVDGRVWLAMVERSDGHGWAVPGGYVEPGEDPADAAVRELREETGLDLANTDWQSFPTRYVKDPRASREAWMVTAPAFVRLLRDDLPVLVGADDARRAAWVRADTYAGLVADLETRFQGQVFRAHVELLRNLLD
jgi:ADP-ribose pyrophosphatase